MNVGVIIIIVLLVLGVLALVGYGIYYFVTAKSNAPPPVPVVNPPSSLNFDYTSYVLTWELSSQNSINSTGSYFVINLVDTKSGDELLNYQLDATTGNFNYNYQFPSDFCSSIVSQYSNDVLEFQVIYYYSFSVYSTIATLN